MKNSFYHDALRAMTTLLIVIGAQTSHADIYVIANVSGIATADLRDIFLGEKQFAGTVKLDPVANIAGQDEFLAKVMKMDAAKYNTAWTKKSFRDGVNPPPTKSGDLEVIDYVKRTPGAIGYVTSEPKGMTVVGKF